ALRARQQRATHRRARNCRGREEGLCCLVGRRQGEHGARAYRVGGVVWRLHRSVWSRLALQLYRECAVQSERCCRASVRGSEVAGLCGRVEPASRCRRPPDVCIRLELLTSTCCRVSAFSAYYLLYDT